MPYDPVLEQQIDRLAAGLGIDDKKKMFGGVGYLKQGKMAFGIHRQWLIIRTSPEQADELLKRPGVSVFDITGRPMRGWLKIEPAGLDPDSGLLELLKLGVQFLQGLNDRD